MTMSNESLAASVREAAEKLVSAWDLIGDARGQNKAAAIKRRAEAVEELREALAHERGVGYHSEGLGAAPSAPAPAIAIPDEAYEALLPLIKWARTLNCASSSGYRRGMWDDVRETYRLRTGDVRKIGELFDRRRDLYENVERAS